LSFLVSMAIGYINFVYHGDPILRNTIPHLDYIPTLTDAEEIAEELEKVLLALEPYSGNPELFFPKQETDFNYMKSLLRRYIEVAREVSQLSKDDYEYRQFIHNAHNLAEELKEDLKYAAGAYFYDPLVIGGGIAVVAILVELFKVH